MATAALTSMSAMTCGPITCGFSKPTEAFQDEAVIRGLAYNRLGNPQASMGVAWGDLTGHHGCDVFITNLRGEMNILYIGDGKGQFTDETMSTGVGPPSLDRTGFGVVALDNELDGDLDLVLVNGKVKRANRQPGARPGEHWNVYAEPGQMLLSDGKGKFRDESPLAGLLGTRIDVSRALVAGRTSTTTAISICWRLRAAGRREFIGTSRRAADTG